MNETTYAAVVGALVAVVATWFLRGLPSPMAMFLRCKRGFRRLRHGRVILLIWAAKNGHTRTVWALAKAGANVNARNGAALMLAAVWGQTEVIRELLKAGADVNARNNNGATALMGAAGEGQTEATLELLKAEADVNARDNLGQTALILAVVSGHTGAILELLNAGADKRARVSGWTAFDAWQSNQKAHPDFQKISNLLRPER